MELFNPRHRILGLAIRLSFSLRDRGNSSYAIFFEKTLSKYEVDSERAGEDISIFPTNLTIQENYREKIEQILFFTPDLSSIYEGEVFDIYSKDSFMSDDKDYTADFEALVVGNSPFMLSDDFKNWIAIANLREIDIEDLQQYYVYGTDYPLADKMLEPAFPRIYYTNIPSKKKISKKTRCPYCGSPILKEDFKYCPYCGSSFRITDK